MLQCVLALAQIIHESLLDVFVQLLHAAAYAAQWVNPSSPPFVPQELLERYLSALDFNPSFLQS